MFFHHTTRYLKAIHDLKPIDLGNNTFTWAATGDDPSFLVDTYKFIPGWHMLEVALEHDQNAAAVKLYPDMGRGFDEATSLYLPLKQGRINKRLVYIPAGLKKLRFDPLEQAGHFTIKHFRLVWLTPWFAHDRLAQRLANMHYRYRAFNKKTILAEIKREAAQKGIHWRGFALELYDQTFERLSSGQNYAEWLAGQGEKSVKQMVAESREVEYQPLISVLLPVYNPKLEWLQACIDSVLDQAYPHWQLCIADDASTDPDIVPLMEQYAQRDSRIRLVQRPENGHIGAATNSALQLAEGDFIALIDHDDCLTASALYQVVKSLQQHPDAGLIYSDEDKLSETGERFDPHFKPDWNPDLLLAQNYISHLGVYRTELVRELGGFRLGYEGAQDHDLALRVTAQLRPDQIVHIPQVLYHWRAASGSTALESSEKDYTTDAGLRAVQSYLVDQNPDALVEVGTFPNTFKVVWPLPTALPKVSLLIPTRDRVEILQPCVDAILELTDYANFELLILDNQSSCADTLSYMETVSQRDSRVRVLRWNHSFNYSAINNFGAQHASGEIIALVNNDIEPINASWLTEMVRQVCRPEIGCVGAKLYYPNDTIQHAGVILGIGGVAGHAHKYFSRNAPGYFSRLHLAHNLSAVTAACLLVRKSVFEQVGGLNEDHLTVAFNDVDLCMKVREAGYRNVWTPYAELYHHESVSRGADDNPKKRERAAAEVEYMRSTWGERLDNDPAYNPNLTLVHEDFSLR